MTSVSFVVSFLKFYVKLTLVNRDFILPPKLIANGRLRSKGNYKHLSDRRIMANPTHRSVLLDHQMIVDGVLMREMKDLIKTVNDETGVEESHLSHMRVIDDRSYTVKHSITDDEAGSGEEKEETIETDMNQSELENFKNEWAEKWNPTIREDEPGFLTRFFKKMNPFAN